MTERKDHGSHGDRDLSVERLDPELDKSLVSADTEQTRRVEKEKDSPEERYRKKGKMVVKDYDIDCSKDSGAEPFHDKDEINLEDLISMYSEAIAFVEKVKEKLPTPEAYQEFLKCLHIYSRKIITRQELQLLVDDMLGKFPDLMEEFNDFVEECTKMEKNLIEEFFPVVRSGNSNFQQL